MPLTTRHNVESYFETHDVKFLAKDPVFTNMATGQEVQGREEVANMIHAMYHVSFDAKAIIRNRVINHKHAVLEFLFTGRHIGEFAGIPASDRVVEVPCTVFYDLENGSIKKARIYMMLNVLMEQIAN